jgi:hypothetical protein
MAGFCFSNSEGKKLLLQGQHDVDFGWISELRKGGNPLVIAI